MNKGRKPTENRVGCPGRRLVANVVFDFWLIDDLDKCNVSSGITVGRWYANGRQLNASLRIFTYLVFWPEDIEYHDRGKLIVFFDVSGAPSA
jgi:hypothetical protein